MIDLHAHMLPGLDDGAHTLEDALAMARLAVEDGISAVAMTPHCIGPVADEVLDAAAFFRRVLRENEVSLNAYPAMEIFGTPETAGMLRRGEMLTLNGSRYPLVEFSFYGTGEEETEILSDLLRNGYRPLVAHPERYVFLQRNPSLVNRWFRMGCLFQINRGSLLGRFGETERELGMALTARGFATVIASDAHSPRSRTPRLHDIYEHLAEEISPLCAQTLLETNPLKILRNRPIMKVEPEWF